jgi:hypothetical protein
VVPAWVAVLLGLLVVVLGSSRLYVARSIQRTTLPWSRRESRDDDFSSDRASFDPATTNTVMGVGLIVLGLIIAVTFAIRYF